MSQLYPDDISPERAAYFWVLLADRVDGNISQPIRQIPSPLLRQMAVGIARCTHHLPGLLQVLGLPQLDGRGIWLGTVLPGIKKELERRERRRRSPKSRRRSAT